MLSVGGGYPVGLRWGLTMAADTEQFINEGLAMRWVTLALAVAAFIVFAMTFAPGGLDGILLIAAFTMTPFVVTAVLAWRWRTAIGQFVLIIVALGYGAWFRHTHLQALQSLDPQGGIAVMLVGIYAAPVLGLLWWGGWWLEKRERLASQ